MSADELRTVLQEHADIRDTTGATARIEAVAGRVRGVRRRRRAVVAAAAVAVVVAAGASVVPAMQRHTPNPADQKAPAVLAGRTVPKTQTATGYTYDYVRGVESKPGADKLQLTVSAGAMPKLVMWATSSTNPRPVVEVKGSYGENYRSAAGGFGRFELVGPGGPAEHFVMTQRQAPAGNRLALAVYTLDRTPPPGITNGLVTFRQQVLDDRLVGGLIGKPGQTDLHTTIKAQHGAVRLTELCYGASGQDLVHVSFDGHEMTASGCDRTPDFDPGVGGGSWTADQNPLPRHGPLRVHVWLTGKNGTAPSASAHAVLGFALYRVSGATYPLAGWPIPVRQESGGHEFDYVRGVQSHPGDRRLTMTVARSDVPRLVTVAVSGQSGRGMVSLRVNGSDADGWEVQNDATGGSWSSGYVIQPGEAPTLALVVRGRVGDTRLGLALSDQVH